MQNVTNVFDWVLQMWYHENENFYNESSKFCDYHFITLNHITINKINLIKKDI